MNYPFYGNYQFQQNPFQQQQVMNNPYMNYQQQMQNQVQQSPFVKYVDNVEMVRATDIPMDGNAYYFPKADGTEIYVKQWLANGQTRVVSFKPVIENEVISQNNAINKEIIDSFYESFESIKTDLKTLSDKVDRISKPTNVKNRKENIADE